MSNNNLVYSSLSEDDKARFSAVGLLGKVADDKEGEDLVELYETGRLSGWAGPKEAQIAWEQLRRTDSFYEDITKYITGEGTNKMMLYEVTRKLLGKDTDNYGQEIGDCVSFGMKNAIEYLQAVEIFLKGDREIWKPVFPPYLYGTGRVFSGGGRLGCNSDGSLGSWMADAVIKYGVLFSDTEGLPSYSGSVAKRWGCRPGPDEKYVNIAKTFPVKSAASINTWEGLKAAIVNGYPVTVASNQGFSMSPSSDGYHRARGSWAHQMCIIGIGTYKGEDYCIILNSWGDVHGQLLDFDDPSVKLPIGCIRARRSEIEDSMIKSGEVFAISGFEGFKKQKLDRDLFKPWR